MYLDAVFFSLIGGSGIFLGALLAGIEHIRPRWLETEFRHTLISFGGGTLLSAIALVLIPEGIKHQSAGSVIITFLLGGSLFMLLERYLALCRTTAAQLIAMMLDFIPEAVIIGAIITKNYHEALLLAVIIFLQNLPESFNAFCEIKRSAALASGKLLAWFFIVGLTGPAYVFVGTHLLRGNDEWLARLMTFCAGGILYIVFNDIAPQAKLRRHWWPSMGALLGFLVGVTGKILVTAGH